MIIGIVGTKGAGKDTIADYLVEKGFVKYSLADPMKQAVKEIFLMSDEQLWGSLKEEIDPRYNVTPRKLLQVFGTELFQYDIYKHIPELSVEPRKLWINRFIQWYKLELIENFPFRCMDKFDVYKTNAINVVIADVRFPHEVDELRKLGGKIIRVIRFSTNDNHASEVEQKNINEDYAVYNDSSIKELHKKIEVIINDCK